MPFNIRREAIIAAAVLGLGLGGFAVAAPAGAATGVGTPTIADANGDLTCATTVTGGGTGTSGAVQVPVGCLTEYFGDNVTVTWSGSGISTELTMQTDGNFVLYAGNGKKWAASTRFATNANGPGCEAMFQSDANLVVRNCNGAAIWSSGTHTYPNGVLDFQADGNLVIRATAGGQALWSTGTES
jgi:hypothetical protein